MKKITTDFVAYVWVLCQTFQIWPKASLYYHMNTYIYLSDIADRISESGRKNVTRSLRELFAWGHPAPVAPSHSPGYA